MNNANRGISQSVLGTSSNLLGICFVLLSFIKMSGRAEFTHVDEFLALPILLFFISSFLSYLALRSNTVSHADRYEKYADTLFIVGLVSLTIVALFLVFEITT